MVYGQHHYVRHTKKPTSWVGAAGKDYDAVLVDATTGHDDGDGGTGPGSALGGNAGPLE